MNKIEFKKRIDKMARFFGEKFNPEKYRHYYYEVKRFDLEDLDEAIKYFKNHKRFFPSPYELLKSLEIARAQRLERQSLENKKKEAKFANQFFANKASSSKCSHDAVRFYVGNILQILNGKRSAVDISKNTDAYYLKRNPGK